MVIVLLFAGPENQNVIHHDHCPFKALEQYAHQPLKNLRRLRYPIWQVFKAEPVHGSNERGPMWVGCSAPTLLPYSAFLDPHTP